MKLKKLSTAVFGAALLAASLAGCSLLPQPPVTPVEKPVVSPPSEDKDAPLDKPAGKPSAGNADGAPLEPGESTAGTGIIEFVDYDGKTASFAHKVSSIEKAPAADVDDLVAEIPKLKGMDVYYITVSSNYVSGDNLEFSSFSTSFDPVDNGGNETQSVSLIGWDNCKSGSIPKPGNDPSITISNCIAAAVPGGQPAPAGAAWSQHDTAYENYGGKPALLLLG